MTETTETRGAFGEVLAELMRQKGIKPSPENVREIAERSDLDASAVLRSMDAESAEDLGYLNDLADELGLSRAEMMVLALSYTFSRGSAEDVRALGRCQFGSRTDKPCWRKATRPYWPGGTASKLCEEHGRACNLAMEEDDLRTDLDEMAEAALSMPDNEPARSALAVAMDRVQADYLRACVRSRAARIVAEQGPSGPKLSPEQAERLAAAHIRSDALSDARHIVRDLPEGSPALGTANRFEIAAVTHEAAERASVEFQRVKREMGAESSPREAGPETGA
jgi:hypothetical protein